MQSNHYDNISKEFPGKNDNFLKSGKIDTESLTRRAISKFRRSNFKIIGGERRRQRRLDRGSFNEAFAKKRKELEPDKTFTWRGKQYNTNRADD